MSDDIFSRMQGAAVDQGVAAANAQNGDDILSRMQGVHASEDKSTTTAVPAPSIVQRIARGMVFDPLAGLSQLAMHGLESLPSGVGNTVNHLLMPVRRAIGLPGTASDLDKTIATNEQQYQNARGTDAGVDLARIGGNIVPSMLIPASRATTIPGVMAKGAAQGAALSALQPVTQGNFSAEKAKQTALGGATGGILSGVLGGAGALVRGGKKVLAPITNPGLPVGDLLNKAANNDQEIPRILEAAQNIVPGSQLTTAQAVGSPAFVQMEKAAGNYPSVKQGLLDREIQNNAARWDVINRVAGTPTDIDAAITARKQATDPLIDSLLTKGRPVETGPIMGQITKLQNSSLGTDPAISSALNDIKSSIADRTKPGYALDVTNGKWKTVPGAPEIKPDLLNGIMQNTRNYVSKYASNGAVSSKQEAALVPLKNSMISALEGANPGYKDYLSTFAQKSVPINTMEAGQSMADSLGNRAVNASGAPSITLGGFNSALKQALKNSPYGIDPAAEQSLRDVAADLQRGTISNSVRFPGSDTAYNLNAPGWLGKQIYGEGFSGPSGIGKVASTIGGALLGGPGGAAAGYMGAGKLGEIAQQKLSEQLKKALLDPKFAAALMRSSSDANARQSLPPAILSLAPYLNAAAVPVIPSILGNGK